MPFHMSTWEEGPEFLDSIIIFLFVWCSVRDLNSRPAAYKAAALPTELTELLDGRATTRCASTPYGAVALAFGPTVTDGRISV